MLATTIATDRQADTYTQILLSSNDRNHPVVVTNNKRRFKKVPANTAQEYKFFRTNTSKITHIGVDIDHQVLPDLLELLEHSAITLPTFVVETTKGVHAHWVLSSPVILNNNNTMHYMDIQKALIAALQGDRRAIGVNRMWRNPSAHSCLIVGESVTFAEMIKMASSMPKHSSETLGRTSKKIVKGRLKNFSIPAEYAVSVENFTYVGKGERNGAMLTFVRNEVMSTHWKYGKDTYKHVYDKAEMANRRMAYPLRPTEIANICKKAVSWVEGKPVRNSKRKLRQINTTRHTDMLQQLAARYDPSIQNEEYLGMSIREFADFFKISTRTVQKHGIIYLLNAAKHLHKEQ
jgi:hypothetical protein